MAIFSARPWLALIAACVAKAFVSLDHCQGTANFSTSSMCLSYMDGLSIKLNPLRVGKADLFWNLRDQDITVVTALPQAANETHYVNLAQNRISVITGVTAAPTAYSLNLSYNPLSPDWLQGPLPVFDLDVSYIPGGLRWFTNSTWIQHLRHLKTLSFRSNQVLAATLSSASLPRSLNRLDLRGNPNLIVTITDCDTLALVQSGLFTLRLDTNFDLNYTRSNCVNGTLRSVNDAAALVCLKTLECPTILPRTPTPITTSRLPQGLPLQEKWSALGLALGLINVAVFGFVGVVFVRKRCLDRRMTHRNTMCSSPGDSDEASWRRHSHPSVPQTHPPQRPAGVPQNM